MKKSKKITEKEEEKIIAVIKKWKGSQGRLSFPAVIKEMVELGMHSYSRQGLYKRPRIRVAIEDRRNYLSLPSSRRGMSHEMENVMTKAEKLRKENERLKKENQSLKEQFLRWQYNAHIRMMTEDQINQPEGVLKLTPIELNQSAKTLDAAIPKSMKERSNSK